MDSGDLFEGVLTGLGNWDVGERKKEKRRKAPNCLSYGPGRRASFMELGRGVEAGDGGFRLFHVGTACGPTR